MVTVQQFKISDRSMQQFIETGSNWLSVAATEKAFNSQKCLITLYIVGWVIKVIVYVWCLCNVLFCDRDLYRFSHGDVLYRFNGENINVMLEYKSSPSTRYLLQINSITWLFCLLSRNQVRLYRNQLEAWRLYYGAINKDAEQVAWMRRLICVFVVHIWRKQILSWRSSNIFSYLLL